MATPRASLSRLRPTRISAPAGLCESSDDRQLRPGDLLHVGLQFLGRRLDLLLWPARPVFGDDDGRPRLPVLRR